MFLCIDMAPSDDEKENLVTESSRASPRTNSMDEWYFCVVCGNECWVTFKKLGGNRCVSCWDIAAWMKDEEPKTKRMKTDAEKEKDSESLQIFASCDLAPLQKAGVRALKSVAIADGHSTPDALRVAKQIADVIVSGGGDKHRGGYGIADITGVVISKSDEEDYTNSSSWDR